MKYNFITELKNVVKKEDNKELNFDDEQINAINLSLKDIKIAPGNMEFIKPHVVYTEGVDTSLLKIVIYYDDTDNLFMTIERNSEIYKLKSFCNGSNIEYLYYDQEAYKTLYNIYDADELDQIDFLTNIEEHFDYVGIEPDGIFNEKIDAEGLPGLMEAFSKTDEPKQRVKA